MPLGRASDQGLCRSSGLACYSCAMASAVRGICLPVLLLATGVASACSLAAPSDASLTAGLHQDGAADSSVSDARGTHDVAMTCTGAGGRCTSGSDCCGGTCTRGTCAAPSMCVEEGQDCSTSPGSPACCAGAICSGAGTCAAVACVGPGQACGGVEECCTGGCHGGTCPGGAGCVAAGEHCSAGGEACCNGTCTGGGHCPP
jgi:hypothetical protein